MYKPGGKKEWRVVFWTHESTKPSRRQCSFSEAKYGKEAASLLSRAVLDYIDVKGVVPDDLHDPPILDPAKKELIEYYSALHESRKALQKRSRPKGSSKGSPEPSIVPLYTLAQTQAQAHSPIMTNTSPSPPNKAAVSEKLSGLASLMDQFPTEMQITGFGILNSNSPNESRVLSPLSTIASTGGGLNTEESPTKTELETGNSNSDNINSSSIHSGFVHNIQIPPIPNITSSAGCNRKGLDEGTGDSNCHTRKSSSPSEVDGLNAMINYAFSNLNKQSPLPAGALTGGGAAHFALMGSIFPNQVAAAPGIQSGHFQASSYQHPSSGYSGFLGPDLNHILSQACQQIAFQNQLNFFSQLGYLNQLAGLTTIAGIGGGNLASGNSSIIGGSLIHNFPLHHNQEPPTSTASTAGIGASAQRNVHANGALNSGSTNPNESNISGNCEDAKTVSVLTDESTSSLADHRRDVHQQGGNSFLLLPPNAKMNNEIVSVPSSADHTPPLFA